jgi:transcriptional regulator with XRE-family HTH domain
MAKKFAELRAKMDPERVARSNAAVKERLMDLSLQELRTQMSGLSQEDVAGLLEVTQGYVSRLERKKDLSVRRLCEYVGALGGEVEIRAKFPEGKEVRVTQYDDLPELEERLAKHG